MHSPKIMFMLLAVFAFCHPALAQQPRTVDEVVDRVVMQEQAEAQALRQYSPLVEIYIQQLRPDTDLGTVPNGDSYFLGRAELAKGVDLEPFTSGGVKSKSSAIAPLPRGFLQMIYVDTNGFDRKHYEFDFVRREFLGEVRCLVFDIYPKPKGTKGRFLGRIWVEDQGYHVVRFNGAFTESSSTSTYFHFDSWRVNTGGNQWLPAQIYSEQGDAVTRKLAFKAQTRLWGYNLSRAQQDLTKILADEPIAPRDQTDSASDPSPAEAQLVWDQQAEENVVDRMERLGLLAPPGDVDKVLETVVNNIEVTNNLDIQPEVRCRVLMTSTLESFTIGHTIVLSRGLIDVLPDEATLATMLALEMGHVVLGHRIDPQYAFFDRMLFDERDTFQHFGFARTPAEEQGANDKAAQLLKNSPYKDQLGTAQLFLHALQSRTNEIPNLISARLGDTVPTGWMIPSGAPSATPANGDPNANVAVALPLGGRIKLDPWTDRLEMLKSKPVSAATQREKLPFEITPFMLYLTYSAGISPAQSVSPTK